jgi:Fur family ferric uptake transcriptional regulator
MALEKDETARLTRTLQNAHVRVTSQRIALLSVLRAATDHPDAEEICARTKKIEPNVSIATVYRTLRLLESQGIVQRHKFEGTGARFETATEKHHDHIVDLDSGAVLEFNSDRIEQLQDEIAAEFGYDVVHHRLELYCRKQAV